MRIYDNRAVSELRRPLRAARSGAASVLFALDDDFSETALPAAAVSSFNVIGGISMLLEVQEQETKREQRETAIRHGHDTLDALDDLKAGLLAGRVAPQQMAQLAELSRQEREALDDPALDALLAQIELRAHVELAKLEMRRKRS